MQMVGLGPSRSWLSTCLCEVYENHPGVLQEVAACGCMAQQVPLRFLGWMFTNHVCCRGECQRRVGVWYVLYLNLPACDDPVCLLGKLKEAFQGRTEDETTVKIQWCQRRGRESLHKCWWSC